MHLFPCKCQSFPAQCSDAGDGNHDPDLEMDPDEVCDSADQRPLPDMDMEEDNRIPVTLLRHIPSYMTAADIDQLQQEIPVQQPVVVPVRTVQEAVAAGYLPPLDMDAGTGVSCAIISNMIPYI